MYVTVCWQVQVAVKQLLAERIAAEEQDFLRDAAELQALDHEHIATLYGVVITADHSYMMVSSNVFLCPRINRASCKSTSESYWIEIKFTHILKL